ncbi:MAG: hypothetical protein ACR2LH_06375 [Thermoleophilaceae bacterium]
MPAPDIVDTSEQAAALKRPPLLVLEPLAAYLDAEGLGSGPIDAQRIGDGHSNVTYLLERGERRFVTVAAALSATAACCVHSRSAAAFASL